MGMEKLVIKKIKNGNDYERKRTIRLTGEEPKEGITSRVYCILVSGRYRLLNGVRTGFVMG